MSDKQIGAIEQMAKNDIIMKAAYDELLAHGTTSTLLSYVSSALDALGFTVTKEGHSWNISI